MDQKDSGMEFLYEQYKKEKSVDTLILGPFYGTQWHLEATSRESSHRWLLYDTRISTQITNRSKGT